MSFGLRRSLADLACRALHLLLPSSLQAWGWAVRCEAASIPDDTRALLFALGSACGLLPRAAAAYLLQPFASQSREGASFSAESIIMKMWEVVTGRPRALGMICATGAVALGLCYMAMAGAPMRYIGINAGAMIIGLTMLALLGRMAAAGQRWTGAAIIAMAGALLATALFGSEVEGAARWVDLGGLAVQPSLLLLPAMLVAFSPHSSAPGSAGIVAAAAAMALQPDRAMAGMLALCLAAVAVIRRDRHIVTALAASVAALAATLSRADTLPAVPYVDQILYSSLDVHAGAGAAVWAGTALLLIPAIVGWIRDAPNRVTYAAFGAVWSAAIMAAALGNYPTPMVGYGGSAIIGYALSLLALPNRAGASADTDARASGATEELASDQHLLVALA